MKVKDLIEKLSKLPQDVPVYTSWCNSEGYSRVDSVRPYCTEYPEQHEIEAEDVHTLSDTAASEHMMSQIVILD